MDFEEQANLTIAILLLLLILSLWFNMYFLAKLKVKDIQEEQIKKQESIQLKAENNMCKNKLRKCLN